MILYVWLVIFGLPLLFRRPNVINLIPLSYFKGFCLFPKLKNKKTTTIILSALFIYFIFLIDQIGINYYCTIVPIATKTSLIYIYFSLVWFAQFELFSLISKANFLIDFHQFHHSSMDSYFSSPRFLKSWLIFIW